MTNKTIKLQIIDLKLEYNNNIELVNKKYFGINNNKWGNIIDIYENINYDIYFPMTDVNKIYYFILVKNHNLIKYNLINNNISYDLIIGENLNKYSFIVNENNLCLNNNLIININEENKYSYYIYEYDINTKENKYINDGILNIKKELIYDIITYNNRNNIYYINNTSNNYIKIINKLDKVPFIILNKNYNYLLNIIDELSNKYEIKIYRDNVSFKLFDYNDNINLINIDNIKNNYNFIINNIKGKILLDENYIKNYIYSDYKYNVLNINNKLVYNNIDYIEKKKIDNLNNKINYINKNSLNKLLLIDNIYKKITIIIESNDLEIGNSFNILLLRDLDRLIIEFDDNNIETNEINILNGIVNVFNKNEVMSKLTKNFLNTTQKIILKDNSLNKYGFIKLECINKINNNFIFNINSFLINNERLINNIFI